MFGFLKKSSLHISRAVLGESSPQSALRMCSRVWEAAGRAPGEEGASFLCPTEIGGGCWKGERRNGDAEHLSWASRHARRTHSFHLFNIYGMPTATPSVGDIAVHNTASTSKEPPVSLGRWNKTEAMLVLDATRPDRGS